MARVRVLVLRAPGSNCDGETQFAFESVGAAVDRLHVNRLMESPELLHQYQVLCIPGGFSYGDDIAAGRILASILQAKLGDALRSFRDRDRLILGVCNGFQVLLKSGFLIEEADGKPQATLSMNSIGRFQDRWVHVELIPGRCVFVRQRAVIAVPVAHGEGKFVVSSRDVITNLETDHRIVARYVDEHGKPGDFPINPNGSMGNIAGVCDETGRVFALMPHPERHVSPWQHPQWTRREVQPIEGDGLQIFRNAVEYFNS